MYDLVIIYSLYINLKIKKRMNFYIIKLFGIIIFCRNYIIFISFNL